MLNAISVDVEDYFHPSEIQASVDISRWSSLPARVEDATRRTLDLLCRHNTLATFFILGWVAERHPDLVRQIAAAGHQIGCHSYAHQLVYSLTPQQFREDTVRARRAIEDACGATPRAYRAPSYSVTRQSFWALEVLVECGFSMDSSIYPIAHDRYGIPGFSRFPTPIATPSGTILEVPVATVQLSPQRVAPVGGGGYLRLLPYRYTAAGLRRINRVDGQPACCYFHPWEIDPGQPRLTRGFVASARTYTGLAGMESKLDRLLSDFRFSTLQTVYGRAL